MTILSTIRTRLRDKIIRTVRNSNRLSGLHGPLPTFPFAAVQGRSRRRRLLILPIETTGTLIHEDCAAQFDLITYTYRGEQGPPETGYFRSLTPVRHLSFKTEFFGQSLERLLRHVVSEPLHDVVLILNGDILTSVSEINKCFFVAETHQLDVFQPSLALDSHYTWPHLLNKPGVIIEEVNFTEVMMLGVSLRLLQAIVAEDRFNISSWGVDNIQVPHLIARHGFVKPHVIHAAIAKHCRPVESGKMRFSNGRTAFDELEAMRKHYNA